jgi:hypothetical protein
MLDLQPGAGAAQHGYRVLAGEGNAFRGGGEVMGNRKTWCKLSDAGGRVLLSKRGAFCPNATRLGFCKSEARAGDLVHYSINGDRSLARVLGVIDEVEPAGDYPGINKGDLLVLRLSNDGTFAYLRVVKRDEVCTVHGPERLDLLAWFARPDLAEDAASVGRYAAYGSLSLADDVLQPHRVAEPGERQGEDAKGVGRKPTIAHGQPPAPAAGGRQQARPGHGVPVALEDEVTQVALDGSRVVEGRVDDLHEPLAPAGQPAARRGQGARRRSPRDELEQRRAGGVDGPRGGRLRRRAEVGADPEPPEGHVRRGEPLPALVVDHHPADLKRAAVVRPQGLARRPPGDRLPLVGAAVD